jgi:osmotically-inducible protein OsmY
MTRAMDTLTNGVYLEIREKDKKGVHMETQKTHNLIESQLEEMINSAIQPKGEHLHAIVRDEAVHLTGEVDRRETKREIACLVEKFPGVQMITNHIRVKLPEERRRVEHF